MQDKSRTVRYIETLVTGHKQKDILIYFYQGFLVRSSTQQEAQLMLTTGSTRLAVSRGQQTWYHSTC